MVRCGVGAAMGFDLNLAFDDLRFLPLSPAMETGTVLVWKKDQALTPAVEAFHRHIRHTSTAAGQVSSRAHLMGTRDASLV